LFGELLGSAEEQPPRAAARDDAARLREPRRLFAGQMRVDAKPTHAFLGEKAGRGGQAVRKQHHGEHGAHQQRQRHAAEEQRPGDQRRW
jgi:hypothetical protein